MTTENAVISLGGMENCMSCFLEAILTALQYLASHPGVPVATSRHSTETREELENAVIHWHDTPCQPVIALRRCEPGPEQRADLRSPEVILRELARDKLDIRPDETDIIRRMSGAIASSGAQKRVLFLAGFVLVGCGTDGNAIATFLAHRIDEVVETHLVSRVGEVLHLLRPNGIAVAVQTSVVSKLGSASRIVQIVDSFAVDKVATRTGRLELACSAELRRENDFLTSYAGSV